MLFCCKEEEPTDNEIKRNKPIREELEKMKNGQVEERRKHCGKNNQTFFNPSAISNIKQCTTENSVECVDETIPLQGLKVQKHLRSKHMKSALRLLWNYSCFYKYRN